MNKIIKGLTVLTLSLATALYIGKTRANAVENGHWVQKDSGKWYYYYLDGTYAMDTIIDGKYYVYWTGVWDGKTLNNNISTEQKSNYNTEAVNYNIQTTNYNTQTVNNIATNGTISYADFTKIADDKMLELINAHRQANGVGTLTWNQTLADMSTQKCEHMIRNNYMDHVFQGHDTSDIQEVGFRHNVDGENILGTSQTFNLTKDDAISLGIVMFNQWKASPGHNYTMLKPNYTKFGFGFGFSNGTAQYSSYGTQQFANNHEGYEESLTLAKGVSSNLME